MNSVAPRVERASRTKLQLKALWLSAVVGWLSFAVCGSATIVDTAVAMKYEIYVQSASGLSYRGARALFSIEFTEPVFGLYSADASVSGPGFSTALYGSADTGMAATYDGPVTFETRAILDNNVPNGTYRFQLLRPEPFSASVTLTGNNYPPGCQLLNYAALQSLSAGNTADLTWSRPGGGSSLASDFVIASVADSQGQVIFSTPDVGRSGSLAGNATGTTLLIPPGRDSIGTVMVVRPVSTVLSPDGDTLGAYATVTSFTIHSTAPVDTTPPQIISRTPELNAYGLAADTEVELTFDEPMREIGTLVGPAITNGRQPLMTWSADHRSVRVRWPQPFPAGPVSLTLPGNSEYLKPSFRDISGNIAAGGTVAASFFVGTLPVFTQQPPVQMSARAGQTLQITAGAIWPGQTLTYQWYRNGQPIAAATQAVLSLPGFSLNDAGIYQLVATNENGATSSNLCLVTADPDQLRQSAFTIYYTGTINGVNRLSLAPGSSLTGFAYVPPESTTALQWRHDGVPIPGATDGSYTWANVQPADSGVYDVLAATPFGDISSATLEIVVTSDIPLPVPAASPGPVVHAGLGGDYSFSSVDVRNLFGLLHQWYFNGAPLEGQTDQLVLKNFAANQVGRYQYIVSNGRDQVVTSDFNIVLATPNAPVISTPPYNRTIPEGSNDSISLIASGPGPLSFQWRKDGVDIPNTDPNVTSSFIVSGLSFPNFSASMTGVYTCVVSNSYGSIETDPVTVGMQPTYAAPTKPTLTITQKVVLAGWIGGVTLNSNQGPNSAYATDHTWKHNGVVGFSPYNHNTYAQINSPKVSDSGQYTVVYSNDYGATESDPVALLVVDPASAPVVSGPAMETTVDIGTMISLSAPVVADPTVSTFRWTHNGQEIKSSNPADQQYYPTSLIIAAAQPWHTGDYTVEVTNAAGKVTTAAAKVTVRPLNAYSSTRLANLSTRALSSSGDATVISGFVITGRDSKRLLIRGTGSGLQKFGIANPARRARITLYRGNEEVASNNGWTNQSDLAPLIVAQQKVGAGLFGADADDSALLVNLAPGAYTVHLISDPADNAAPGVGLVEVFDADTGFPSSKLVNLSTRAFVGTGEQIAIPGLVVVGSSPKTYLFRAVGPTLARYGVSGRLTNPALRVYNTQLGDLATNDDWEGAPNLSDLLAATDEVGAFKLDAGSTDAAVLVTLKPGLYSVLVSGADGGTGIALVEAYEVP